TTTLAGTTTTAAASTMTSAGSTSTTHQITTTTTQITTTTVGPNVIAPATTAVPTTPGLVLDNGDQQAMPTQLGSKSLLEVVSEAVDLAQMADAYKLHGWTAPQAFIASPTGRSYPNEIRNLADAQHQVDNYIATVLGAREMTFFFHLTADPGSTL